MASGLDDRAVAVVFIVMLMAASVAGYAFLTMMNQKDADPRDASHTYTVAGTLGDAACSGTGSSKYTNESGIDRVYSIEFDFSTPSESRSISFGMAMDPDGTPRSEIYDRIGDEKAGDMDIGIWKCTSKGATYTFYVGSNCTMQRIVIETEDYKVTGTMDGGVY